MRMYYSTNRKSPHVSFREALLAGLAPDKGLYMPVQIPQLNRETLEVMEELPYSEIAYLVLRQFLEGEIPDDELLELVKDAYTYPVPLEHVTERTYVMRLDQGPTASFKDFAARMMGRLMNYYLTRDRGKLCILTATSGDTGSAIANAFYGLDHIEVIILYPKDEVTPSQRKQMTTLGRNITVLSVDGKFDDCQALVKQAFSDDELTSLSLSSANSINIGRLLPQSVYYFYSWAKLRNDPGEQPLFVIPSGNFGNMMGSVIAQRMGLPVSQLIIATNENDEFPRFHHSGAYAKVSPSRNCISSAMNVGHPSNLARLVDLFGGRMDEQGNVSISPDLEAMRSLIKAVSVSDAQTKQAIRDAWDRYGLLLEPHGAVGWAALEQCPETALTSAGESRLRILLETAHPAKFPEQIKEVLSLEVEVPPSLAGLDTLEEHVISIKNSYGAFKDLLLKRRGA